MSGWVRALDGLRRWAEAVEYADEEQLRLAVNLQWIALISGVASALVSLIYLWVIRRPETAWALWVVAGVTLLVIGLVRRKRLNAASLLYLGMMLGIVTYELYRTNGIRSVGVTLYPVLVIFAGVLLSRRLFLLYLGLLLWSLGFLLYAETRGWIVQNLEPASFTIFLIYALIMLATALVTGILTESLRNALARARRDEQSLAAQNAILERAEQALREREERHRRAIEAIGGVPYLRDYVTGAYTFMGEGIVHLTGYPAAEMTTELFTSLIEAVTLRGAAAQFTLEEALQRARTGELAEWQSDIRIRDHAGRTRWLADGAIEITGPDGRSLGAIGVLQDITDRKEAEAALHQWNETLEQRVAERTEALRLRTAQLEAVNRELESFTYTVSHDLRAPIRAVDGFAHLLLEEFHERLGAGGRHYLERVRDNTRQMGTLIDDLLAFTRLGRLTPRRMAIAVQDIERMIQATAEQLQADPPVDIVVGALPPCHADLALLRQVFGHLLANAFKFTRRRPGARIEVGGQLAEAGPLYFVRDNGVGFDMQYVHKLFGVFQRLHRVEEYEGTGVGLAIVQRIVQKHGGRVWAEAEPDKGATFFFTLPALTNETVPSDQTR